MSQSRRSKKLAPSMMRFVLPLILTMMMTCVVSGISTWRAIGWSELFLGKWFLSWMISWAVAYPAMILFMPIAKKIAFLVVEKPTGGKPPKAE